tara:strand:+ start:464 stop:916 length:453 start_codon:yes stop_codon:yes gene_type:complete
MSAAKHDLDIDRGSTFKLFLEYQTAGSTGIDLNGFTADMQVRRSTDASDIILHLQGNTMERGVTGGGSTGSYTLGNTFEGTAGTGGFFLNATSAGATGGTTGGIFAFVDNTTMKNVPSGKHFYDVELTDTDGTVTRILEGRFRVAPDVTR